MSVELCSTPALKGLGNVKGWAQETEKVPKKPGEEPVIIKNLFQLLFTFLYPGSFLQKLWDNKQWKK